MTNWELVVQGFDGETLFLTFPLSLTEELKSCSKQHGVTLFAVLLARFKEPDQRLKFNPIPVCDRRPNDNIRLPTIAVEQAVEAD